MKIDASLIPSVVEGYDVCIIGSGPAGLTVALELMHSGQKICVIESGYLDPKEGRGSALKDVESRGIKIRPDSRERVVGGTSETWSGFIAPLDDFDYSPTSGVHEGWPISPAEVDEHINKRGIRYSIPSIDQFQHDYNDLPLTELPGIQSKTFQVQLKPLRYRKAFEHVFLSDSVDLIYGGTVTFLEQNVDAESTFVEKVRLADKHGIQHLVKATRFVLAASAIESVRLAMHSLIPDPYDQIGRNFMNHPKGNIARVHFTKPISRQHPLFQAGGRKFGRYIGLRLSSDAQLQNGLLNPYIRLEPSFSNRSRPRAERLSVAFKALKRGRKNSGLRIKANLVLAVLMSVGGLPGVALNAIGKARARRQKMVSSAVVRCFTDMEPRPENRIYLSKTMDEFGVPLPIVEHTTSPLAILSVQRLLSDLQLALEQLGAGQVQPNEESLSSLLSNDASHHLGGLRMGRDPKNSVVGTDLRFHTVQNLYAAGGTVFPTGGSANPTMTVIGLSIRLAEELRTSAEKKETVCSTEDSIGFLVVGSGRRVREDVVPVIEKLNGAHISGLFSTSKQEIFGVDRVYQVNVLAALSEEELLASRYVYIAVPPKQVKAALTELTKFDCSKKILIVDTPAILGDGLDPLYDRFQAVTLAEDCAYLPWISLLADAQPPIKHIEFDRSGFAYHAVALGRAIAANGGQRPGLRKARSKKDNAAIELADGTSISLIGPRDYKNGKIRMHRADGTVIGSHHEGDMNAVVEPIVENFKCLGFRQGAKTVTLTPEQSFLAGTFSPTDTIVSKMLDIKRVGLHRLLVELMNNQSFYTIAEGVDDARASGPG